MLLGDFCRTRQQAWRWQTACSMGCDGRSIVNPIVKIWSCLQSPVIPSVIYIFPATVLAYNMKITQKNVGCVSFSGRCY